MMKCPNCDREVFGFWKYGLYHACSKKCFRAMVEDGRIPKIKPYTAVPELGIRESRPDDLKIVMP